MSSAELSALIGHEFARRELLDEALTHPSAVGDQPKKRGRSRWRPQPTYQRLEFLGDRVLGLVIADWLWQSFETEPEGDLTRRFHYLVRRETLARVAESIGLDRHIELSRAEAGRGTNRKPSVLADACEAVIAAIYIDAGLEAARNFIRRWWEPLMAEMDAPPRDPKETLQEWGHARGLGLPSYEVVSTSGPGHALRFTVAVRLGAFEEQATGSSKQGAEIGAAAALLDRLSDSDAENRKQARR